MDLLLTHGYFLYEDPQERRVMRPYPPLGILYISSFLKRQGFDIGIFDSTFHRRIDFLHLLEQHRPPVVGIYCNLMTRQNVLEMIRLCRQQGSIVVLGGPEPASYAMEYLAHGADVVVVGEGEQAMAELLPSLARHGPRRLHDIQGIVFQDEDGRVVSTPARPFIWNLDACPPPDRSAIDIEAYLHLWRKHHGMGSISLITARGCPYTCTWCSHSVFGYSHRRRSPQSVAEEVEEIRATYAPDMLWYADDVFTIHRRWFFRYAEELRRRRIRLPFECISREDRLDEDIIRTLAEMGCIRLWIGSESGSQRILDAMERRTDARRVRQITHLLQRYGIEAGMFIMLGYEGEEIEDLEATAEHLKEANPDLFLTTVAYPIKGTPYYDQIAHRIITETPWEKRTDRDLTVAGRRSRRFYRFANRWLVNEVALHRQRTNGRRNYLRMAKSFVNAKVGWLGMRWTQHERERVVTAPVAVDSKHSSEKVLPVSP
jgi:radical SAM superfamily enzyme YgiQ (UPF0313 family)